MLTSSINPKKEGMQREKQILLALEEYRALGIEQIAAKFFSDITYSQRKAQDVMLRLYKKERVCRYREDDGYVYFLDKKPGMLKHLIALNWVRLYLEKMCTPEESIYTFDYEMDFGILRTDAFVAVENFKNKECKYYFIELDRGTNRFDKPVRFSRFFNKGWHEDYYWFKDAGVFPTILVVTTTENRERTVNKMIEEWNTADLKYSVKRMESIIFSY